MYVAEQTSFTVEREARMLTRMLPFDRIRTELRHQRNAKDWTLDQLAAASGVDRATIHQLENVRTYPTVDKTAFETVRKLIEALGLTLTDFFAELEGLPALINHQSTKDLSAGAAKADNPANGSGLQAAFDRRITDHFNASTVELVVGAINKNSTAIADISAELRQLRGALTAVVGDRAVPSHEPAREDRPRKTAGRARGR